MNGPYTLTGHDLVAKGITKIQATLPELGLKDVYPTGSWLEEKQIQSAIEARKQLLGAERIEKGCVLSHAEWRENLNLAEVTQKSGGHWQFMGHNVGKKLFLYPEEALFLIEVNSLLLKYNDVKVSLQQAYSLLLGNKSRRNQFKVYASLSRLGYKVFRHKDTKTLLDNVNDSDHNENPSSNDETVIACVSENSLSNYNKDLKDGVISNVIQNDLDEQQDKDTTKEMEHESIDKDDGSQKIMDNLEDVFICDNSKQYETSVYQSQIEKLSKRLQKTSDAKNLQKSFKNLPNLLHNQIVSVKVPDNALIPNNITLNKSEYTINLQSIKKRSLSPPATGSRTYNVTDEVNGDHIRRVTGSQRGTRRNRNAANFHSFNTRIQTNQLHFRPFNFWQPFIRTNYFQFGMSLQRPFITNMYTPPRFQYNPGFQNFCRPNFNNSSRGYRGNGRQSRKSSRDNTKIFFYGSLKRLAERLKNHYISGNIEPLNLEAINKLIQTFNTRYNSRLKLTDDYEIVDETVLETITLNDDADSRSKRPRLIDRCETYNANFNSIKDLAKRLKDLENNDRATTRHRRAFSNLIKTFNKSYKSDVYVTSNFEVFDKSQVFHITLDSSSSDSECVVDESIKASGTKKLRNPFNILKRLSEKSNKSIVKPSTSRECTARFDEDLVSDKYNDVILKNFGKNWLPEIKDFGRPEIISVDTLNNITRPGNFIYEFMKNLPKNVKSWLDLKIAFLRSLEETSEVLQKESDSENNSCHKSLITREDCIDVATVLKKLSIIKSADRATETNMVIDYDVYNRDVKNFRKTSPPPPHFRVLCLDESAHFPSSEEIAALHAKYEDSICIVFAVVGDGSISYVQIKPTKLPMYITNTNNN